jgi:hypothetical protein
MHELEFFVKIAGKDVAVRMQASTFGAVANDIITHRHVMMGYHAVRSAYKVSAENGARAEKARKRVDDYCFYEDKGD